VGAFVCAVLLSSVGCDSKSTIAFEMLKKEIKDVNAHPTPTPATVEAERASLIQDYKKLVDEIWPNYNGIQVRLKGSSLMAYHSFFNRYEFDIGGDGPRVAVWMHYHDAALKHGKITRVGVSGTGAYSSGVWYDVNKVTP
jgi:hypothetical protein